jgi:hypothetical protein
MSNIEDLRTNPAVKGILSDASVTVVSTLWFESEALELPYKGGTGKVASERLHWHDESRIEVVEHSSPWSVDRDGALLRPVHAAVSLVREASARARNRL